MAGCNVIQLLLIKCTVIYLFISPDCTEALPDSCVECRRLDLVPPKWSKSGTDVKNLALLCNVKERQCSLDFYEDIIAFNKSTPYRCNDNEYCDVDVYLRCPSHTYSIGM